MKPKQEIRPMDAYQALSNWLTRKRYPITDKLQSNWLTGKRYPITDNYNLIG